MTKQKKQKPSQLPVKVLSKAVKKTETVIPDELSGIWTTELTTAWNKLDEKQKSFLLEWYSNGFHGTKAYMYAFRGTNENSANSGASRLLASDNIYVIRQAIQATLRPPVERIHQVYLDAMGAETPIFSGENHIMDQPDHKNRMVGADRLIKMHNLEKPAELKITHAGKIDLVIDLSSLSDILNGHSPE